MPFTIYIVAPPGARPDMLATEDLADSVRRIESVGALGALEVARIRHDLNNPLTSALAEVQLLLFDANDEELRESLEVNQNQLRRMRDLIASTSHMRPPRG